MKNFCLLFVLLSTFACQSSSPKSTSSNDSPSTYTKLDVAAFSQKLKTIPNAQLIDVRTPEEYQQGHIEGAKNINYYDDDFNTQLAQLNKDQPIFVYCKSGGRSGKSAKQLKDLTFSTIYDLKGGYTAWAKRSQ